MDTDITITLPLTWQGFYVILTALGLALAAGMIMLTLNEQQRQTARTPLSLLTALGWMLLPVWLLIFAGTLWQVWHLLTGAPSMLAGKTPLGTGALLAALLGAPFVVWGAVLRQRMVDFQKEGHITERITAAVEQLGAEKTVKKIVEGETQETSEPNIEVRIGAILSLERIAQDSTRYDKGRDHVRVMEILCAYVRENSNARPPRDFPLPEWEPLAEDATAEARKEHEAWREARFAVSEDGNAREWAASLPKPRADIAQAMQVLGRRTAEQRLVEAAWPDAPNGATIWPFDTPSPELREGTDHAPLTGAEIIAFKEKLNAWRKTLRNYSGYQLDLRDANLQGANLTAHRPDASDMVFSGAWLAGARMEGADLADARMEGAGLVEARMEGADLRGARMEGAILVGARMGEATLNVARMDGAALWLARMEGAKLFAARMEGAFLKSTTFECAALRNVGYSNVDICADQIEPMFGDLSVILPDNMDRPTHWPDWVLPQGGENDFETQWRKWRDDPEGYSPPPNPGG